MTIWVLLAAVLLFGIDMALHKWKLTAALDVVVGVLVWYLLLNTPMDFHPDSPVLNSGPDIVAFFMGIVAASAVTVAIAAWMLKDRLSRALPEEVARSAESAGA